MKRLISILVLIVSLNCKAQERSPILKDSVAPMSPTFKQHRKWMEYDSIQKAKWRKEHKNEKTATVNNHYKYVIDCYVFDEKLISDVVNGRRHFDYDTLGKK